MDKQRFLVRVESDAALPSFLLRRHGDDRRITDPDLDQPHDLYLRSDRDDRDELAHRTFSEAEALAACREWHQIQPSLDVAVNWRATTLVILPWTSTAAPARPLRLLPLIGESGAPLELKHALGAWTSSRANTRSCNEPPIFHRATRAAGATTPCAEVSAMWCPRGRPPRSVSARIAPGGCSASVCERFPFFEQHWLESHWAGFDVLNAAPVLMSPSQAEAVAEALRTNPEFVDVAVHRASIRSWLGSGEFSAGATFPVRRMRANPSLSAVAGVTVYWLVWPVPAL